jgi:hypothetical protein
MHSEKSLSDYQKRSVRGWLHERFSACDLLQIADAIWCICDLVSDTELLPFIRSMRYGIATVYT